MKKRILCLALLLCVAAFAFSGCIRMRTTVKISPFGTVDSEILLMLSDALGDTEEQTSSQVEKYKEQGYTVEKISDDGYSGYRMYKSESIFSSSSESSDEMIKSTVEGLKVILDIPWNPNDDDEESEAAIMAASGELIKNAKGYAEIIITLPGKPIAHNATSVSEDGKTLTWDLLALGDRTSLHVEFSALDVVMGWIIIGACALVVIIAVIVIIIVVAAKKKKAKAASALTDTAEKTEKAAEETAAAVEKTSEAGE